MIEDLKKELRKRLGDDPVIDKVVDLLYDGSGITDPSARTFVIGSQFWQMMRENTEMTAKEIEVELSARYPMLSPKGVYFIRRRYVVGGRRRKTGPRDK